MKIGAQYSHLNGYEWLIHHQRDLWDEISDTISLIDAEECRTKVSKEKTMAGAKLYSPSDLNKLFKERLYERGWKRPGRTSFLTHSDPDVIKQLIPLTFEEQKEFSKKKGIELLSSYNEADFLKERVSLEIQFGKYAFVQFDLFIKHAADYMNDKIDLGIEIVPMKTMEEHMSSGPPYYEKHLHEIMRQGRIFPPVPLILIGVEP